MIDRVNSFKELGDGDARAKEQMGQNEKDLGRHHLCISYRRPKTKKNLISLIKKLYPHILMIRNPKAFEAWSICSCRVHFLITELRMLPGLCGS